MRSVRVRLVSLVALALGSVSLVSTSHAAHSIRVDDPPEGNFAVQPLSSPFTPLASDLLTSPFQIGIVSPPSGTNGYFFYNVSTNENAVDWCIGTCDWNPPIEPGDNNPIRTWSGDIVAQLFTSPTTLNDGSQAVDVSLYYDCTDPFTISIGGKSLADIPCASPTDTMDSSYLVTEDANGNLSVAPAAVPEPDTISLWLIGFGLLGFVRLRSVYSSAGRRSSHEPLKSA